ncbi:armadillo-type protein [Cyathus striatus]|nr:armadillo-type protein [Cyathus striatus]
MDLQTLTSLFTTTFNPDPNIRKAAELQIRKIGNEEGMITALLQIIASDSIDLPTKQAVSVWLKNRIHTTYTLEAPSPRRPELGVISPSDRAALRAHILPLLANSPSKSISVQLANVLKAIVAHDFPARWPGLLDDVKRLLVSGELREVHAGCVAALECARAFRYRQQTDFLPQIIISIFPTLVTLGQRVLSSLPSPLPPTISDEVPTLLHLILKTYKTSIVVNLSAHQQSHDSIVPWGQLLFAVVQMQVPVKEGEDEEDREKNEWWKAKKWAYGILGRLFHRFGNPSQLPSTMQEIYGAFSQHFVTMFAPEILGIYLRQVELYVSNQAWLSKKCQYQIFSFFTECVKPKSTWALLKPHFETLVSSFVFPQLAFNDEKRALWENDPVDYVRVSVDEYETFATPVSAATSFLFQLASNRTKTTFMPILGFINTVLRSNAAAPQRFGALNMTAALGPWIMRHPEVKGNMEQFVLQFVTPEFSAPEPYLRAIACEVLGTVVKNGFVFSSEEHLGTHFRAAALALTEMVILYESVRTAVSPDVGKVITNLLQLSDETDLDILNHSMEAMVDRFQTELLPVAAQLTARLCESYLRLARESAAQEEADAQNVDADGALVDVDDDKTFAAMGIAKTIGTIVSSIEGAPEILSQVQEVIIPVITFTLEHKLLDLFDNMYELVDSLTYKLRSISPNMWPVFEQTYKLFKNDAVDFLEEMLPSLDNFVSFGAEVVKVNSTYKQMLVDIYTTSITNDQLGENDRVNGSKLAESILLNLRGNVDDYLQIIVNTAIGIFDKANTASLRLANLEVLVNAVLYNPSAALHFMESYRPGMSRVFFDKWFAAINSDNRLPRVHDKKLTVLALCALLELTPESIPEPLREGWPAIVGGALKIFKDLPKAIEERKALEASLQEESDEEEDVDEKFLNLTENDDDVWDEDSAYLEMLARESARLREQSENADDDEDSDEESDEEIDEELGYLSPLDNVDPYLAFKSALTTFQMQNAPNYQAATTLLDVDQQTLLMEVMRIAEQSGNTQS